MNTSFENKTLVVEKKNETINERFTDVEQLMLSEGFITVVFGGGKVWGYPLEEVASFFTMGE